MLIGSEKIEQDFEVLQEKGFIPGVQSDTSSQALGLLHYDEREKGGWFKGKELTAFVGGLQVATSTKQMIEGLLGIDMHSYQDAWFSPNFDDISQEDKRLLEKQGFSFASAALAPGYLKQVNTAFRKTLNLSYREVSTDVALQELGNINFPGQRDNATFRYTHDLLFRVWHFHIDKDDSDIDKEKLKKITHDFHYFALQYHSDSFRAKSREESIMFTEKLEYFLSEVKVFGVE